MNWGPVIVLSRLIRPTVRAQRLSRSIGSRQSGPCTPYARMEPLRVEGPVVQGFGRGSKELGIPTANFPEPVVARLPADLPTGIYYGWARVDRGETHKMVVSVGWNPFYKNEKKSMETHIIHEYESDFYGSWLKVLVSGYIRPEENYDSLAALIQAIQSDIATAHRELETEPMLRLQTDAFFAQPGSQQPQARL